MQVRSLCALYIDAGYLLAGAANRRTGTSLRTGVVVDYEQLIGNLVDQVEWRSELRLLRVHWYDSARFGRPTPEQAQIGLLPRVKVRLGRIGYDGEQKGVDLRIGLDLVQHARIGAIDVMYLVSGDDDLTEAVEEAQANGVEVILLAVPDSDGEPYGVSAHLHRAADGIALLVADKLDEVVRSTGPPRPQPTPASEQELLGLDTAPAADGDVDAATAIEEALAPVAEQAVAPAEPTSSLFAEHRKALFLSRTAPSEIAALSGTTESASTVAPESSRTPQAIAIIVENVAAQVLRSWRASASSEQLHALEVGRPSVPREIDRALLLDLSSALGSYDLPDPVRHQVRREFWRQFENPPGD